MTLPSSFLQPPRLQAEGTRLEKSKEEDSGKSQDEGGPGARNNPIRRGQPTSICPLQPSPVPRGPGLISPSPAWRHQSWRSTGQHHEEEEGGDRLSRGSRGLSQQHHSTTADLLWGVCFHAPLKRTERAALPPCVKMGVHAMRMGV